MKIEVKLDQSSVREIERTMKRLSKKIVGEVADKALAVVADEFKRDLQQAIRTNIKPSSSTGTRSLWSRSVREKSYRRGNKSLTNRNAVAKYKGRSRNAKWVMVSQKQDYFYARARELGSDKHPLWRKKSSSNPNKIMAMPARPVFMPAMAKSMPKLAKMFIRSFKVESLKAVLSEKVK